MERLKVGSGASATATLENGTSVSVRSLEPKRPKPSDVAKHEAEHIEAAGRIVSATIIPCGSAEGQTQPERLTATAAAAAEAMGHNGTSWDKFVTEYHLGVDWGIAKSAARSALYGREDERHEVATILEERLTIGQPDVEEARLRAKNKRQGIVLVEINLNKPGEKPQKHIRQTFHGQINISDLIPEAPSTRN